MSSKEISTLKVEAVNSDAQINMNMWILPSTLTLT